MQITVNHSWSLKLSLNLIKVKAKDIHGEESGWGHLIVIVNYNLHLQNINVQNNLELSSQESEITNLRSQDIPIESPSTIKVNTPMVANKSILKK